VCEQEGGRRGRALLNNESFSRSARAQTISLSHLEQAVDTPDGELQAGALRAAGGLWGSDVSIRWGKGKGRGVVERKSSLPLFSLPRAPLRFPRHAPGLTFFLPSASDFIVPLAPLPESPLAPLPDMVAEFGRTDEEEREEGGERCARPLPVVL
jgi:hypothetical protein